MATYRPEQRGRAQAKQAREVAKRAARQAKEKAITKEPDKLTPAQVLKAAYDRR